MKIADHDGSVYRAMALAERHHAGQKYGGDSYYIGHLVPVALYAMDYGADDTLIAAAYLHDALEDTSCTAQEILDACGPDVLRLVQAVTDEPGDTRSARQLLTYPKIRSAGPDAIFLKLIDRLANVQSCWATHDTKLFMYHREYVRFRVSLNRPSITALDQRLQQLWQRLDNLLGWRG